MQIKHIIPITVFLMLFNLKTIGQDIKTDSLFLNVNLKIKHDRKIPYNNFDVGFKWNPFREKNIKVSVRSIPLSNHEKWKYSDIDTTYTISKEDYRQINDSIFKIESRPIAKNLCAIKLPSLGGYKCTLEYGAYDYKTSYTLDNPRSDKAYSKMFYNTCFIILEKIGFNPLEILN